MAAQIKPSEISSPTISRAYIDAVTNTTRDVQGQSTPVQSVQLTFLDGPFDGQTMTINHGDIISLTPEQLIHQGETVIINSVPTGDLGEIQHWIIDRYRLPRLGVLIGSFFFLVLVSAGLKGMGSIVGMLASILVISFYIVPQILAGNDPLLVTLSGSIPMLLASFYLAHGFKRQTTVALISTLIVLFISGILSILSVKLTHLTGLGSEDAASLRIGATSAINLHGLLLGSIIIGIIGVLDDITTGQVAAVWELKKANPKLNFRDLVVRAGRIGTEHIASLVNTLVMAYAGSAMPVFIFLILNPAGEPLWLILNSELLAEEIVRTITGSIGLILAVPITSTIAAWYITKPNQQHS